MGLDKVMEGCILSVGLGFCICGHHIMRRVKEHTASAPCFISSASSSIARAGALNLDGPASDDMFVMSDSTGVY
jgi:hypothetical protein